MFLESVHWKINFTAFASCSKDGVSKPMSKVCEQGKAAIQDIADGEEQVMFRRTTINYYWDVERKTIYAKQFLDVQESSFQLSVKKYT